MLYLHHRAILFVEPVWRSMSANQHVPDLGDPPNSVRSRPDCAVEDDAVQPVSRDVRAAVVGAQRAYPVPQSAVALLLTEPEKVSRFIVPVKARTAGPIGDKPGPGGRVSEIAPGPRERLLVGQLRPLEVDDDRLPRLRHPVPFSDLAADLLQPVIELHVLFAP